MRLTWIPGRHAGDDTLGKIVREFQTIIFPLSLSLDISLGMI